MRRPRRGVDAREPGRTAAVACDRNRRGPGAAFRFGPCHIAADRFGTSGFEAST